MEIPWRISLCSTLILVLLSCTVFNRVAGWNYEFDKGKCATVYSGANYTGINLLISEGNFYSDLTELNMHPNIRSFYGALESEDTWNKQIISAQVEQNCRLLVCKDSYLTGGCKWMNSSVSALETEWSKTISSVSCQCPDVNCISRNCSNIILSENECGRGFFESDCKSCNGSYLTILQSEKPEVGRFAAHISSVFIKPGCTFQTYSDEDFEGEETVLASEFNREWDKSFQIKSYKCECAHTNSINSFSVHRNTSNYPFAISIPATSREILHLLKQSPAHPGLSAALTSIRNSRSPKNAYILALGMTGSGILSTLNFLLGREVAQVGGSVNLPEGIHEYRISTPVPDLGCTNCELRIIDVPGFGSTRGLESDARLMAGLDEYLKNHEELKHRHPNVVLIFSKFSDNKVRTSVSGFKKTLRTVDLLKEKLFDSKHSNAVFVLTHFMSEATRVRKNPGPKIKQFRQVIEEHTLLPKPVRMVVAENKAEDYLLPILNGFYYLENKELYPKNLIQKIQEATETYDPIGEAIFRSVIQNENEGNRTITDVLFSLGRVFSKEQHYLSKLLEPFIDYEPSEVFNITQVVYNEEISSFLKQKYPASLHYAQHALKLQGIFTKQDIPSSKPGIVNVFRNIRTDPLIDELLERAFDLKLPELEFDVTAGFGYNILTDTILSSSPFLQGTKISSVIGYKMPNTVTCRLVYDVADIFEIYDTFKEYLQNRILSMSTEQSKVKFTLSRSTRPGFNTLENFNSNNTNGNETSALREYRVFQVSLNPEQKLNPDFATILKEIPDLNQTDRISVDQWKSFFVKYGTHVVKSVYGGGAIESKFRITNSSTEGALDNIKYGVQEYFQRFQDLAEKLEFNSTNITHTLTSHYLKFFGGDVKYHSQELTSMASQEASVNLEAFVKSLQVAPVILASSIQILPLWKYVESFDPIAALKIEKASEMLLSGKLVYFNPTERDPALPSLTDSLEKSLEAFELQLKYNSLNFQNITNLIASRTTSTEASTSKENLETDRPQRSETSSVVENSTENLRLLNIRSREDAKKIEDLEAAMKKLEEQLDAFRRNRTEAGVWTTIPTTSKPRETQTPQTVEDVLTTTEDGSSVPKEDELPEYKKRLDDLEFFFRKAREEQERIQQELLERMQNHTKAAESVTVAPPPFRPTTSKPRPSRPRKLTTQRPYFRNPTSTTTTTPKPTYSYNFVYEPLKSTETCNRKEGCYKQTGLSYDVVKDRALNKSPFQPYADRFCKYLPLDQPDQHTPYYVYQNFETIEKYIDFRQIILGTGLKLNRYQYRGVLVPGHHILHQDSYMSISIEYRLYENRIISDCSDLDGEFVDEVRALPMYYNTSCSSMNIWKGFIQKFGTHFVNSSYVGGYIYIRPYGAFKSKIMNTYLNNQEQLRNFFAKLNWQNETFEFEVTGGDRTILRTRREFTKDNFQRWSTSLRTEGADSLKNDLTVNSLAPLIGRLKPSLVQAFQTASNDYFSGQLGSCNGDASRQPCNELTNGRDCYSLANTSCTWFNPGQHYCVLNSDCVGESNSPYGVCRCLPGAIFMRPGHCYREVY